MNLPFSILAELAVGPVELTKENAIEIAIIVIVGTFLLFLALRALKFAILKFSLPTLLVSPIQTAVKWIGIVLILATVLQRFNIPVYTILSTTLAMVAVGFVAVWSVLCNFLCSFLLIILKPFSINDWVEFPGERIGGSVTDLTLLYTVLRDDDGQTFQVPNSLFFQKTIKRIVAAGSTDLSHSLEANTEKIGRSIPEKPVGKPA